MKSVFRYFPFLFFVFVFYFWFWVYPGHIQNQALFSLYENDFHWFGGFCIYPGGWTDWLGAFFSQFYRFPGIGVGLQVLSILLFYFLLLKNRFFELPLLLKPWFCLIPVVLLFLLQTQYSFLFGNTLQVLAWYGFFYFWSGRSNSRFRLFSGLLFCWLAVSLFGALPALLWWFTLLLAGIVRQEGRFFLLSVLVCGVGSFFLWHFLFLVDGQEWFTFFPRVHEFIHPGLAWALFLWLPGYFLLRLAEIYTGYSIFGRFSIHSGAGICLGVVGLLLWWGREKLYYPEVENILNLQRCALEGKWDELLAVEVIDEVNRPSVYVLRNLALAHKGQLAEHLLDYPQHGIEGLVHPLDKNYFGNLSLSLMYEWLGITNESLRWSVEASMAHKDNPPAFLMQRIASDLMKLGKEAAAAKYLKRLSAVPFYSSWARSKLLQTSRVEYGRKLKTGEAFYADSTILSDTHTPVPADFMVGAMGPFEDLFRLAENNPSDSHVRDYLLCGFLLSGDVSGFYEWFGKYYRPGYPYPLPRLYREALMLVGFLKIDGEVDQKYTIDHTEFGQFQVYMKRCLQYGNDREAASLALKEEYGRTFWYYMHFK